MKSRSLSPTLFLRETTRDMFEWILCNRLAKPFALELILPGRLSGPTFEQAAERADAVEPNLEASVCDGLTFIEILLRFLDANVREVLMRRAAEYLFEEPHEMKL